MAITQSKVTAQGRISVPAEVRRRLGVGPGSILVWEERDGEFVVRRFSRFTSDELHAALFGDQPVPATGATVVEDGIRKYFGRRHARR